VDTEDAPAEGRDEGGEGTGVQPDAPVSRYAWKPQAGEGLREADAQDGACAGERGVTPQTGEETER